MTSPRKVLLILLALDSLALLVVFNIVSLLRGVDTGSHLVVTPLAGPLLALVFAIYLIDGYNGRTDMISLDYTSMHTIALFSAAMMMLLLTFALLPSGYELQSSRIVIALSYLVLTPITLSYRRFVYQHSAQMRGTRSIVFVGDAASCRGFKDDCERAGTLQPVVYSTANPQSVAPWENERTGQPALESFAGVLEDIRDGRLEVEAIVFRESSRELQTDISQKLLKLYFSGVPTYTLELFHEVYWRKIPLYRLNQTWLFQEGFQIAREPVFERLKRVTDIAFALVGLLLAAPFLLLGSLAVWIEDRGPVFFAQNRVGRNRVLFRVYKLRSMRVAGADGGDLYTQPGDSRVTRVGRFLRSTRIDEMPQLWNVLRGDMSLIGPRAEWDLLVEKYEREIPCYYFRHLVKPGITGWAQVNYPYGASLDDTLRKLEYDLFYIRHFSFLIDASIVMKTVHVMLFGKGR